MLKLNYIAHILLNTKYKIILFLIFYIICIKLHYWDTYTVDCMKSFKTPTNQFEYERLLKTETEAHLSGLGNLNEEELKMKKFAFDYRKDYIYKSFLNKINTRGGHHYGVEAETAKNVFNTIDPYLQHIIEYKQNHERLIQRSFELEQTITNLENMQRPYQETIQRMQAQDISKIKNIIYDFLPLKEENYILQQRINDLEAQKFALELKNKRLVHTSNEYSQQLTEADSSIKNFKRPRSTPSFNADVTQQLQELRTNLQDLTERLNTQETNIYNRSNINSETTVATNNCTIN